MPTFDSQAAKAAGYSDEEIQSFLAAQQAQNNQAMSHPAGMAQTSTPLPNDPTWGMSPGQEFAAGIGRGMVHTGRSIGNLVGLVPDQALQNEKEIDAPLLRTRGGETGNILGEAAITTPITMGASGAVGQLGKLGATIAGNPILNAGLQGGVQGMVTSDPGERVPNAALGAVTGAGLAAGGSLVGKLARGLNRTPEAQYLLDKGISLTPGQMNPQGMANQFEQTAESVPGVKQIIHGAREGAEQDFQRSVIQQGAAPGTVIKPSENIHEMLQQAYDSYAPLYDQAKGIPVKAAVMNGPQGTKLSYLFDQAATAPGTTAQARDAAKSALQNELTQLPPSPTSTDLLNLRSDIRALARKAKLANDTIAQDKAVIFDQADQHVTRALNSQLPPDALKALQTADSQYGRYKIVENAVARSKDNVAGLTPSKLSQAIYDATADPAYARGAGGDLRDLAQAGTRVFQTVSPPTGARVLTLGAGAAGAALAPHAAIPLGAGMLGLTGSQTGRRFAAGMTRPQLAVQSLTDALQRAIPADVRGAVGNLAGRTATQAALPYAPQALASAAALATLLKKPAPPTQPQ